MDKDNKKLIEDNEEPLLECYPKKGGFRTLPFIIGTEAFEKMAIYGLMPNMPLYLIKQYSMEMTTASNVMFMWSAATSFTPLFGAVIADSFFGRFLTIGFGTVICFLGMILLWSTTLIRHVSSSLCDKSSETCSSTATFPNILLYSSLGLISIGAGGIRSSSLAFGANQLEFERASCITGSYFSWYYASYTLSILIALTGIVYIQDTLGWGIGFAIPALLMAFGSVSFLLASPLYIKLKTKTSIVTGFVQVAIASFRNRHLTILESDGVQYHYVTGSDLVFPSAKLRFMNKACIVRDSEKDLNLNGEAKDPWSVCTVDQVEELKALLRVIPIWSSGMIMSINICQTTFPVLQAASMNRHITSSFAIPAASFNTFTIIAVILWVVLYDRVFLPLASLSLGKPFRPSTKTRMGIGIFLSCLAMLVTSLVESVRRRGLATSALWLVPQYCLTGFAEASNAIAQNEFYFSELPRSMSSIATTLLGIGVFFANLIASVIMNAVDAISKEDGKESWISSDINKGHYDYYYLILAGLSVANMIYFLICSSAYGPSKEEIKICEEEEEDVM